MLISYYANQVNSKLVIGIFRQRPQPLYEHAISFANSLDMIFGIETIYCVMRWFMQHREANMDMNLKLVADAIFTYDADDYSNEDKVVGDNTVAIMFPFIRSQITLMTSQPGMQPIVLPPINATKLK